MKRYWKHSLGIVLVLSLALNVATVYWDIYPFLSKRLQTTHESILMSEEHPVATITKSSLAMVNASKISMVWHEANGIVENLRVLRNPRNRKEFYTYNYPRAYLYYGIGEAVLANPTDTESRDAFLAALNKVIGPDGMPLFEINRIDQVPFALAALSAYRITQDNRYLIFADTFYNYLNESVRSDGLLIYRPGHIVLMSDALGMAVPFLIDYYIVTGNENAKNIARIQLEYYTQHGIDKDNGIPAHAIHLETGAKLGSANWGRGIGWYYIALAHFHKQTGEFEKEYELLTQTLLKLRNSDGQWTQYPGSDRNFDASSSTMFLHSMLLNNAGDISPEEALQTLVPYITREGEILQTSGDTYDMNRYSHTFGKSELSQGMLMLILAQQNRNANTTSSPSNAPSL